MNQREIEISKVVNYQGVYKNRQELIDIMISDGFKKNDLIYGLQYIQVRTKHGTESKFYQLNKGEWSKKYKVETLLHSNGTYEVRTF